MGGVEHAARHPDAERTLCPHRLQGFLVCRTDGQVAFQQGAVPRSVKTAPRISSVLVESSEMIISQNALRFVLRGSCTSLPLWYMPRMARSRHSTEAS